MSERVVVDASLAVSWVLPETHSEAALARSADWIARGVALLSPGLFAAEVANALHKRVLRKELDLGAAHEALAIIASFGIELREEPGVPEDALTLASRYNRPCTYDCYYLALATHMDCEFWTGDERFYNAVHPHDPRIHWIGLNSHS